MQKIGYYKYLCSRGWDIWRTEGTVTLLAKINNQYFGRHRSIQLDDLSWSLPPAQPENPAISAEIVPVAPYYREKGLLVINDYQAFRRTRLAETDCPASEDKNKEKTIIISIWQEETDVFQVIEPLLQQDYSNWHLYLLDSGANKKIRETAASFGDPRIECLTCSAETPPTAVINQIIKNKDSNYLAYLAGILPPEKDIFANFLSEIALDPTLEAIHYYGDEQGPALSLHRLSNLFLEKNE